MKDESNSEFRRYTVGALICAVLTIAAFWAVMGLQLSRGTALWLTGVAAVIQVAIQMRCFLHLRWRGQKREDLQLLLFSALLLALMVGGTLWIMSSLSGRMG